MHGWSDTFANFFGMSIGYFIYDTVDIILDKRPTAIMISHHIAVILGLQSVDTQLFNYMEVENVPTLCSFSRNCR